MANTAAVYCRQGTLNSLKLGKARLVVSSRNRLFRCCEWVFRASTHQHTLCCLVGHSRCYGATRSVCFLLRLRVYRNIQRTEICVCYHTRGAPTRLSQTPLNTHMHCFRCDVDRLQVCFVYELLIVSRPNPKSSGSVGVGADVVRLRSTWNCKKRRPPQ